MQPYASPFRFRFNPANEHYSQFSSQESNNFMDDIHSNVPPATKSDENTEFWWIFAAVFVVVFFLVLMFGLCLQLLARAILKHNQVCVS